MRKNETTAAAGPAWLFTGNTGMAAGPDAERVRYGLWEVDGLFCRVEVSGESDQIYLSTGGMWR